MKKVFALFVIASAFTFAACGAKKTDETVTGHESTSVEAPVEPIISDDSTKKDSATMANDSAAMKAAEAPAAEGHAPAAH